MVQELRKNENWEVLAAALREEFEWRPGSGKLRARIHPPLIRALICGGREFTDYDFLADQMDAISSEVPIGTVIHGAARGADTLAGEWAEARRIAVVAYAADWEALGRRAGPLRNEKMLEEGSPDLVVAFPGGRGTAHMICISARAGRPVLRVELSGRSCLLADPLAEESPLAVPRPTMGQ